MIGNRQIRVLLALIAAVSVATPAPAQILGGAKGLPGLPGDLPSSLPGGLPPGLREGDGLRAAGGLPTLALSRVDRLTDELVNAPLSELRRLTSEALLRAHPDLVEADDHGQPVVRGQIIALGLNDTTAARLRQAGFSVLGRANLGALGLQVFELRPPKGMPTIDAVRRLHDLDPTGQYDFDHLYQPGGKVDGAASTGGGASAYGDLGEARGQRIGLVDSSVAQSDPALTKARLIQRAFGPGGPRPTAHATAVASLIVGEAGRFHGAAPGAVLYVADVYGPTPVGGSAEDVARGLAWLAESKTPVISISLVGPPNLLLRAAVEALIAKGHLVVAAVGNDGPASPPLYPAAYAGVVAVTGVDGRQRVLPEASRGTHVDFAAPGADMAAGSVQGGYVAVRGTSFATPIVAGLLARATRTLTPAQAIEALGRRATDLGAAGPDPIYGRGLVGADLRTDPGAVGASQTLIGKYLKPPG